MSAARLKRSVPYAPSPASAHTSTAAHPPSGATAGAIPQAAAPIDDRSNRASPITMAYGGIGASGSVSHT